MDRLSSLGQASFARAGSGRWTARLLALALLGGFLVLRVWDPLPVQAVRLKIFDLYQVLQPRVSAARPVAIVNIDEDSLETYGQWPWPRDLIADMVDRIFAAGAVALAFDVVFAEPDRLSPGQLADNIADLDDGLREGLRRLPDNDALLAQAFRAGRVVAGEASYSQVGRRRHEPLAKAAFAYLGGDPSGYLLRFKTLVGNIAPLEQAALGLGVFTFQPAVDGVVRRVPTLIVVDDVIRPSLSLELLRVATGQSTYAVKVDKAGVRGIVIAGVEIPTDRQGRIWVHYGPSDPARYISAGDLLAGQLPPGRLAGKLVLVGTSAAGLQDIKTTPRNQTMPGVEIHAQLIETILSGHHLLRPHYALGAELVLTAVVGLIVILLIPVLGALWTLLLGAGIASIVAAASWYLYTEHLLLIDGSYALFSSFAVYSLLAYLNYLREEHLRRQVRGAFGQYLSPVLVEQLADDPDRLQLGGESREMSFLFSDVRGFTSISEQLKDRPQELTHLINRLLTPLTNVILEHGGTIDKYMGDCVMAFWNAPFDDLEHARHACETALAMAEPLVAFNRGLAEDEDLGRLDLPPVRIGIGVNTGHCVVGNMGSEQRFDYTVLGDAVNLASRLEGQTKAYGVDIIVGSQTADAAKSSFALLELDLVRVAGKAEPEQIYALLGGAEMARSAGFRALRESHEALLARYLAQDWAGARSRLAEARSRADGLDLAALHHLYETRVTWLENNPPGPDWDGVTTAESK